KRTKTSRRRSAPTRTIPRHPRQRQTTPRTAGTTDEIAHRRGPQKPPGRVSAVWVATGVAATHTRTGNRWWSQVRSLSGPLRSRCKSARLISPALGGRFQAGGLDAGRRCSNILRYALLADLRDRGAQADVCVLEG